MAKLYSKNLNTANQTARKIAEKRIIRFKSQNALYIFVEDIKNPYLKTRRMRYGNPKKPYYVGNKNYDPSINYLIEKGVLSKSITKKQHDGYVIHTRVTFDVNKESLSNFLKTI